jgi:hypothetical protein
MGFKSGYSRLARLFAKSRDEWRAKAIARRKEIRLLELKVRDLEISRAKWKEKALTAADAYQRRTDKAEEKAPEDEEEEKRTPAALAEISPSIPPRGHQYPVSTIQIAIQSQVEGLVSLRGTEKVFELFSPFLPSELQEVPDHATVQRWTQRLGLFLLHQPVPRRDDWVFVPDHFLERGMTKCLVILGIPHAQLAQCGYSPSHKSMQLLALEVVEHSTGERVRESLEQLSRKVGEPVQIVSDHGSDLRKGIELFRETHPKTIHSYDISHRLARLLKAQVETDPWWKDFHEQCNQLRTKLQQTEWAFLMPPAKRTKGRFMAMERIEWVLNLLAYDERGDFSELPPVYSLNWACRQVIGRQFGPEAQRAVLCLGSEDRFSDLKSLRRKIVGLIGTEEPLPEEFWALADERRRRFDEFFGKLLEDRQAYALYAQLLRLIKSSQTLLKNEGLHADSAEDLAKQFRLLTIADEPVRHFGEKILSAVREEAKKLPKEHIGLASSDICESVIGKEKLFSKKSPLQEIGKSILMIPVFLTNVTTQLVRTGMERVRNRDLKEWAINTFGDSAITKRRAAFKGGFDDTNTGGTIATVED